MECGEWRHCSYICETEGGAGESSGDGGHDSVIPIRCKYITGLIGLLPALRAWYLIVRVSSR